MKDSSLEPSGRFPISFQIEFDIINTSSLFMKPNPQKKMLKKRLSSGVNRKMYQWEAGEPWPGSAHPHRLWLDIWSQSQWNVRRVMTGMVIGRLWPTSDLEVRKGHGSLNRLWADVLSDHGKVTEPDEDTEESLTTSTFQYRFLFFQARFYSLKCWQFAKPAPWVTVATPVKIKAANSANGGRFTTSNF